ALKQLEEFAREAPLAQDEELVLGLKTSLGRRGLHDRLPLVSDPYGSYFEGKSRIHGGWYSDPRPSFDSLFPGLAPPPAKPKEGPSSWPAAARDLARSVLRTEKLTGLAGGVEVVRETEQFNAHRGRLTQRARRLELFTPGAWLTRSEDDRSATLVQ